MTDPTTGSSPEPMAPPPVSPPPTTGWAAPPPPVRVSGSAEFVYADVPNRIFAYIIDAIILFIVNVVVIIVLAGVGLGNSVFGVGSIILAIVGLIISGAYFIYTWTAMRGTVGMKALGMQIGNAGDGKTITMDQGIRRWIALGAPFTIAQVFNPIPGIGLLISLAALAWVIFLLYTTAQSPTKQGYHDVFAGTQVVKAARSAG
ncbi:MAG: hypothetical protein QOE66_461 [Chloroflexota bacterium]|jgi:uncharacterized RDD family membrane protein YckC|nr:hypothetical protein [Chloroflexota bacterium]